MQEAEALKQMVSPSMYRCSSFRGGIVQIWITRACDKSCFNCTQGSNLRGANTRISLEQFEQACLSLVDYFGVVGIFGGNPAIHPQFDKICEILRKHIPFERRGLWCNNPLGKGLIMAETFNPAVSNLNVHLDRDAYNAFRKDWPAAAPFGLERDSRHSPVYTAMKDVIEDESERWGLIANCDINKNWSSLIGVYKQELRGYFCEIAGAMAMLHQHDPNWPDVGVKIEPGWWKKSMQDFKDQVRQCCHSCGVPLRGYGSLAQAADTCGVEQVSQTHADVYLPKHPLRVVQLVTKREQVSQGALGQFTDYIGNGENKK